MESNNYEWFIASTVESMLPRFSDKGIGLGMIIDMNWDYYPDTNDKHQKKEKFRKQVLLLFHRPSNYTKVLHRDVTDINTFDFMQTKDPIHMTQTSDHDSCWRSDGLNWIFKTFCEAWEYFERFDGVEGRDIAPNFHYSVFCGSPTHYHIEMEKWDKNDHYCLDYNVKIGEKIGMHEISKFMPEILMGRGIS